MPTVSECLADWLRKKQPALEPKTFYQYRSIAQRDIIPALGDYDIQMLDHEIMQTFFDSLDHLARETLKTHKNVLSMLFKEHEIDDLIKGVSVFSHRPKKEIIPFTEQEINLLLLNCPIKSRDLHDMILLAYRTGMRRGEIFGLCKQDINIADKFLSVRRSVTSIDHKTYYIKDVKTKSSKRRIDLDDVCMAMLLERIEQPGSQFIFPGADGEYKNPHYIPHKFRYLCRKAGVTPRRFHDLRHTHATLLLTKGIHPKIVQERLGHANISITMDTYSHLIPGMQQEAVKVLNLL